jgi:tRNA threonylcarbamoyladenosine biosynthesis protein TsaB
VTVPVLLAFDTATEVCSVAVARGARIVERMETVGQRHSERVLPMARQLLADEGVALTELDAVAFGAGPGAFTGLRIACGVAQGLAYGLERPVVPVGNLAALAWLAATLAPDARRVATAIDARMNEVYWAVYDVRGDDAVEVAAPSLSAAAALPALLAAAAPDALAGDALEVFAVALAPIAVRHRLPRARASAGAIVRLAQAAYARGETVAAAEAAPVYVRDRVAQTIDERRAVLAPLAGSR